MFWHFYDMLDLYTVIRVYFVLRREKPDIILTHNLMGLSFLADHAWEHVFLLLTAALGTIALFSGFKRYHRKMYPIYCLALGGIIYSLKESLGEDFHPYLIALGAGLIIFAHVMNVKLCRSCKTC